MRRITPMAITVSSLCRKLRVLITFAQKCPVRNAVPFKLSNRSPTGSALGALTHGETLRARRPRGGGTASAAGLSLTACGGSGGPSTAAQSSTSASAGSSTGGQGAAGASSGTSSDTTGGTGTGAGTGAGTGTAGGTGAGTGTSGTGTSGGTGKKAAARTGTTASGALRKTAHLGFSAAPAGVKNEIVVNLKNTGSATCSMHGFPGVQLLGADGLADKGPDAARTDTTTPTVTVAPGEETRFLLHYIPHTSGSGKTGLPP